MRWDTIDFPGLGPMEVKVDDDLVKELPTPDEIREWIRQAEANVDFALERHVPWGCTDCDEEGDGQDGDGADSAAGAIAHAVSSLLWGGFTGDSENHWCTMCLIEAFPADDNSFERQLGEPMLVLRLTDGRIVADPEQPTEPKESNA